MRWFTSDIHFGHKNIMRFCPDTRGEFRDVSDMAQTIIQRFNSVVQDEDDVFFLGDVAFGQDGIAHLSRMKGRKHLIVGNHDKALLKEIKKKGIRPFETIQDYLEIDIGKTRVVMFHFPIFEWNKMHHGAIHLHGHTHGNVKVLGKAFDVGIDSVLIPGHSPGVPYSEEQIIAVAAQHDMRLHHGKENT